VLSSSIEEKDNSIRNEALTIINKQVFTVKYLWVSFDPRGGTVLFVFDPK